MVTARGGEKSKHEVGSDVVQLACSVWENFDISKTRLRDAEGLDCEMGSRVIFLYYLPVECNGDGGVF
jgi:hypothetical protein